MFPPGSQHAHAHAHALQVLEAVTQCRKLLSIEVNPPIGAAVEAGVISLLVDRLRDDDDSGIQFEAAWALTNIASGSSQHTQAVVGSGAVADFVRLLESPRDDVCEQAIWALGNIAGDCVALRDAVLEEGALPPLVECMGVPGAKVSIMRNCAWTLSNLCRGKPHPEMEMVRAALPALSSAIFSQDDEVATDCCWALSYIADASVQMVIEAGATQRLVELLSHQSTAVVTPALRALGSLVTGDDLQTQVVLNCGVLPVLGPLMASAKRSITKEACWMLSNITAGNTEQIQAVCDAGLIPPLIDCMGMADDFKVLKEAAWAVSNLTSGGTAEQIGYVVELGAIAALCNALGLARDKGDPKVIQVALEGLDNILKSRPANGGQNAYTDLVEECGGLNSIEMLQEHEHEEIYQQAHALIEAYFSADNE